jgi:hypothetical protein
MALLGSTARRVAVVDAYEFPSSIRQRFALEHHTFTPEQIATVEAATRQWFRLAARRPKAALSMPSVIVDDLWHEMVLHTREYAAFCDAAFGRFLHHVPESAMTGPEAAANQGRTLRTTFELAQQDEKCAATELPVLFRVDRDLAVKGGRRYLADCGGRGHCYPLPGTVCLQHLRGTGRLVRGHWDIRTAEHDNNVYGHGGRAGGGAACGVGGGDG